MRGRSVARVKELTGGDGTRAVIEAVGLTSAIGMEIGVVRDCTINPGSVFDRTVDFADVPAGYRAMADRKAPKVLIRPELS
jgi:threonine dehydrogenase-like Zn-dependent dehydrogenase